jgi:hypothetical protein
MNYEYAEEYADTNESEYIEEETQEPPREEVENGKKRKRRSLRVKRQEDYESEEESEENVRLLCCSFQKYLHCSESVVNTTCGYETAHFTKSFLDRMSGPLIQVIHRNISHKITQPRPACYSTLLYATLRYSTLLYSTLLYATLRYSTLLYATLRYSTLLYATLRYSTL